MRRSIRDEQEKQMERLRANKAALMSRFDECYAEEVNAEVAVHGCNNLMRRVSVVILLALAAMFGLCVRAALPAEPIQFIQFAEAM
jgi:hypothetical protein